MSRLWGAVSSLNFNKSLWNLAILLIWRRSFECCQRIFPNLSMSKVEKKTWKGLLAGKGLMQSPWGSSPVGGLIQRVDFSGFIVLEGTWAQVRWPSMADGWYKWDCRLGHFRLNKQNNIGLFGTVLVSFWKKIYRYSEFGLLLVLKFLKRYFFMLQSGKKSV